MTIIKWTVKDRSPVSIRVGRIVAHLGVIEGVKKSLKMLVIMTINRIMNCCLVIRSNRTD